MKPFIFIVTFALYIFTAYPSVAPYRDSGEMSTVIPTLGVAHPPGYPLYIITSNAISRLIPFGNTAKKISAVSALFMSLAVVILYSILLLLLTDGNPAANGRALSATAAALSLCFGLSYLNWYLAIVQEMYTMGVLMATAAVYFILAGKTPMAFFILGMSLGVRTETILTLPAFFLYVLKTDGKEKFFARIFKPSLFFILGASVFFYSYIRANTAPLINWGDPSTFSKLLSSLMRRSHGGTLDLISAGYAAGENFSDGILHYLTHIARDYCGIPFVAAIAGIFYFFKYKKKLLILSLGGWSVSGLLFIYLANMPPNPHALAILEAHYLLPDIFMWILSSGGFIYFYKKSSAKIIPSSSTTTVAVSAAGALAIFFMSASFLDAGKHAGFFAKPSDYILEDYARAIRVTAPPDSAVVVKEDVQVFTLWYEKYISGKRPDLTIIPSGLSGSPWYQKSQSASGVNLVRLNPEDESWKNFIDLNPDRRIFFTNDADFPYSKNFIVEPLFLLNNVRTSEKTTTVGKLPGRTPPAANSNPSEFYSLRLYDPRYTSYAREFFTPDIIEDYSKGWHQAGFSLMSQNKFSDARKYFFMALYLNPDNLPQIPFQLGWGYFAEGDYRTAAKYYNFATILYERYLKLADKYKADTGLKNSISKEAAEVWLHKGVTNERLADDENALYCYRRAAEIYPALSAAYYNTAVIYWKKNDFNLAAEYLRRTLQVDPSNADAQKYLSILQSKLHSLQK